MYQCENCTYTFSERKSKCPHCGVTFSGERRVAELERDRVRAARNVLLAETILITVLVALAALITRSIGGTLLVIGGVGGVVTLGMIPKCGIRKGFGLSSFLWNLLILVGIAMIGSFRWWCLTIPVGYYAVAFFLEWLVNLILRAPAQLEQRRRERELKRSSAKERAEREHAAFLDYILEKVDRYGFLGLTKNERRFLRRVSEAIDKERPEKQTRQVGDITQGVSQFVFLSCTCGLRLKIPANFKNNKVVCPRCEREVDLPTR